jgi:hydroxymethylglutaryl-CoA lyase
MKDKKIIIHEVGPRDGLQFEKAAVPLDEKIRWIDQISESGIDIIQLGSFVNPEKVPQMADTDKLFEHYKTNNRKGVIYSGLVLTE